MTQVVNLSGTTLLTTISLVQTSASPGKPGPQTIGQISPDDTEALIDAIERAVFRFSCYEHRQAVTIFAAACLAETVKQADATGNPARIEVRRDVHTMPTTTIAEVSMRTGGPGLNGMRKPAWTELWHSPSPERFVRTDMTTMRAAEHFGVALDDLCRWTLGRVRRRTSRIPVGLKGEMPCFESYEGNHVRARFNAGNGMTWDGARLVTGDIFPETMRMAMKDSPMSMVTAHPVFRSGEQIIRTVSTQATRTMIIPKRSEILLDEGGRQLSLAEAERLGGMFRTRRYERKEKR